MQMQIYRNACAAFSLLIFRRVCCCIGCSAVTNLRSQALRSRADKYTFARIMAENRIEKMIYRQEGGRGGEGGGGGRKSATEGTQKPR
jgi:hypothetical protein